MWRIIIYPQWKYETIEKKLKTLEEDGYRLSEVWFLYLFKFKKVQPGKARYIVTYTYLKEWGMIEYGYWLRRKLGAHSISAFPFSSTTFYRIKDESQDFPELFTFRNHYLRHVVKLRIGFSIVTAGWFCGILILASGILGRIIAACGFFSSVLYGLYCLVGICYLTSMKKHPD